MDKTVAGLIGAVAALSATAPSHAASPAPQSIEAALQANSYADLLKPIPNALELMNVALTEPVNPQVADHNIEKAQLVVIQHHHHHRHYRRRRYYHHHHHHHDHY